MKSLQLIHIVTSMSFTSLTQISLFIYFLVYPSHVIYMNVSRLFKLSTSSIYSKFYLKGPQDSQNSI